MAQSVVAQYGSEPSMLDTTGVCLLSLDGGGVRGLSTLYILKGLMARLNYQRQSDGLPRVKPCEVFDLIGGTSTGGLIAIMLGRLEMDVDACISAYSTLMETVFEDNSSGLPVSWSGKVKARFNSAKLKSAIEDAISKTDASSADAFNDGKKRGCHTFVCATAKETASVTRLRSYTIPDEGEIPATICQAALATSAATGFFDPVSIRARHFVDGALGANNPVDEVEGEAANIWSPNTGDLKPLVKCFISIGTGHPGKKALEDNIAKFLSKSLVGIATETEETERKFIARWAGHYDEKRYFRFNVDHGLQEVGLAEYKEQGRIEATTDEYLRHPVQKSRVRDCIKNLQQKQNRAPDNLQKFINISTMEYDFERLCSKLTPAARLRVGHGGNITSLLESAIEHRNDNDLGEILAQIKSCKIRYDIDAKTTTGLPLLSIAAKHGYENGVDKLLSYGASVNQRDCYVSCPLIWAACRGKVNVVARLLKADGVDVDAVDMEQMSALTWAIERQFLRTAQLLADASQMSKGELAEKVIAWIRLRRIGITPGYPPDVRIGYEI